MDVDAMIDRIEAVGELAAWEQRLYDMEGGDWNGPFATIDPDEAI